MIQNKKSIVLDLDDTLYPKRDYLLQVYYLFANFVEFTALDPQAKDLLDFLKETYENEGEEHLFDKAVSRFPSIAVYRENFERLHHQARLPLKLYMFPQVRSLLDTCWSEGRQLILLTQGDPMMQLNKIRQTDWQGLDQVLKVYFEEELYFRQLEPLEFLMQEYTLKSSELAYIGRSERSRAYAGRAGIDIVSPEEITQKK